MKQIINLFGILFLGYIFFSSSPTFGQSQELVRGKVTYTKDNSAIPGVSVAEVDKDNRTVNGTVTDMNGNYALRVSNLKNSLVFSFIGFTTKTEPINGRTSIDVALEDASHQLDEVVIVGQQNVAGLGLSQRDLTSSIQKVTADELKGISSPSIDDALQGRLAGVDITASSGNPGASMSIRIRGASSLNASTKPLIVVDDAIFETEIGDFDFATADEEKYAQMLSIAPDDIKDITVLIDPSTTARWGTRGANGVLYITTKRGEKGKAKLNYSYRGALSFMPDPIKMLTGDEYSTLIAEGIMNVKGVPLDPSQRKEFQYDPYDAFYYYNYSNNTNWIDEISQQGYDQEHNLSLTGGGDKATYRFSLGYKNQTGNTIGTKYTRLNTRLNLDYKVSDKIMFRAGIAFTRGDNDKSYDSKIRDMAYSRMPNMSVYERAFNGSYSSVFLTPETGPTGPITSGNAQGAYSGNYNPVAMADLGKFNIINNRIMPNFQLSYSIVKGLQLQSDLNFDLSNDKTTKALPQNATGRPQTDANSNRNEKSESDYFFFESSNQLNYNISLGEKHNFFVGLASTVSESSTPVLTGVTSNAPSTVLTDPSIISNIQDLTTKTSRSRTFRTSAIAQYKYANKYRISGGVNREGNSKLAKKHRYGIFPNIGGAWTVSEESFMKALPFIQDFTIRASYGLTGNMGFKQSVLSSYQTFGWDYMGFPAIYQANPELSDLTWEKIYATSYSGEMTFKNGSYILADFYQKITDDMLNTTQEISSTSGYSSIANNIGKMKVQGWSLKFKTPIVKSKSKKGLSADFSFTVANDVNKWLKLSKSAQETGLDDKTIKNQNYVTFQLVDRPIGSFYGYKYKGVYSTPDDVVALDKNGNRILDASGNPVTMRFNYSKADPGYVFQAGDAIYEDINHDGNINYMDMVYLGNSNPLFYGGFNFAFKWRNFSWNFDFYYRYGNDIVNMTKSNLEKMSNYDNQSMAVLRRWRNPGDVTDIPRALINGTNYNYLASDRFVEDGSFLRLKRVYLSYTLPKTLTDKLRLSRVDFSVQCSNLMTLTNYTGQDPEVSYDGGKKIGMDNSLTPRSYDLNFAINVAF